MTPRGWATVALAVLVVVAGAVAVLRVPWRRPPAPRADQRAALASLPVEEVARGRALRAALRPPGYAARAVSLLVALALGLTPLGARLVRLVGGPWPVRAVVGGLAVVFLGGLVTLPLAASRETILRRYGLSTQRWRGWAVDVLKGYGVAAVLGAIALLGFYATARYSPGWWWAWAGLGAAALTVLLSFVFPVLVEPIFNRFTPITGTVLGALGGASAVISVYLIGQCSVLLHRAGVATVAEPGSVALLLALAALAGLLAEPAQSALSRRVEARADGHALALTDDPGTFEAMEARLATVNLADPAPPRLEHLLFATHPTTVERMAAARAYTRSQRKMTQ